MTRVPRSSKERTMLSLAPTSITRMVTGPPGYRIGSGGATARKTSARMSTADACARAGIRLGFYYSQSQDWHEPNGAGNDWDFPADDKKDYDQYLRGKAEPQIRELLTGYGKVALIWFDTPRMMTGDRPHRFTRIVRELQPDTLIDGRLGVEGDYASTGDNVIPPIESEYLADDLRGHTRVRLLISGLISHAEADQPARAGDVLDLATFWGDLLRR